MPEKMLPGKYDDFGQERGTVSLGAIKFNLKNNVTMAEIKDAEAREQISPRAYEGRIK
jgi:hypothetical protein